MLEIKDLHVQFHTSDHEAVRGIDLTVQDGEIMGLVGESGSGKTVTAMMVSGLLRPELALAWYFDLPHADAEGFGFVRAGDDAAVVVRQHDHGSPDKIGTEDPLAGGVEVVAVAKAVHRRCYLKVLTT
jgi:energy-coupling factor transporter ATP-binding protein EcfA2